MRKIFKNASKVANQGHYLERLVGLAKIFRPELVPVLSSTLELQLETCKRDWTDALTDSVSRSLVYTLTELEPTENEWRAVVWGLDYDVLVEKKLIDFRLREGASNEK